VDETYLKIDGYWRYGFRAMDAYGQIVDGYLSDRRTTAAAHAFFAQSLVARGVTPTRVTTDTATCYPPALRTGLPLAEQRASQYLTNGLERDQQLNGRVRSMRRFKTTAHASTCCRDIL